MRWGKGSVKRKSMRVIHFGVLESGRSIIVDSELPPVSRRVP